MRFNNYLKKNSMLEVHFFVACIYIWKTRFIRNGHNKVLKQSTKIVCPKFSYPSHTLNAPMDLSFIGITIM